jgi:hypothetical protein
MESAPLYENVGMESAPLYENVENYLDVEVPGQHRRADADDAEPGPGRSTGPASRHPVG